MPEANKPNAGFDRFQVWREYEGVTMHFNDLIIRLRSQSLGGVAAVATLAAVVARNDTTAELRWVSSRVLLLCSALSGSPCGSSTWDITIAFLSAQLMLYLSLKGKVRVLLQLNASF